MAYVADQNDLNANQQPGTANNSPMAQLPQTSSGVGAGATATNTTTGGSPQGAASVPNSTKAPPVQDLQAYLAANAPQAVQMGQNIANNLNQTQQTVTGDINSGQQNVNQQVQQSNVAPNQELVNQARAEFVGEPEDIKVTLTLSFPIFNM